MDFRWAAAIALWSMLIGPVIGPPVNSKASSARSAAPLVQKTVNAAVR